MCCVFFDICFMYMYILILHTDVFDLYKITKRELYPEI